MSIRVEALTKRFGGHVLFENLCLELCPGVTALTGGSGSGKTTLLRMIAGLDRDYDGRITGVPDTVSFLFQEDRLLPWYDVEKNIGFVLRDVMSKPQAAEAVRRIIHDVRLTGHENKLPHALSGGMQRRVAMARAFCYPSALLLLDEPFKGFDEKLLLELVSLFEKVCRDTQKTILLVTHEPWLIERLGCAVVDVGALTAG